MALVEVGGGVVDEHKMRGQSVYLVEHEELPSGRKVMGTMAFTMVAGLREPAGVYLAAGRQHTHCW